MYLDSDLLELSDDIIVSSCYDIFVHDIGRSLGHDSREDHSASAPEIRGRDISSPQFRRSDDDRFVRIEDLYLSTQILQFGQIIESSFIQGLEDL